VLQPSISLVTTGRLNAIKYRVSMKVHVDLVALLKMLGGIMLGLQIEVDILNGRTRRPIPWALHEVGYRPSDRNGS